MAQCLKDETLIQEIHVRIVERQGHEESPWEGCISVYSQLKGIFEVWNDDVHEDEDIDSYRFTVYLEGAGKPGTVVNGDVSCMSLGIHDQGVIFASRIEVPEHGPQQMATSTRVAMRI
ncbi:hypothetical protein J007_02780 [Cryptococcus neoformans]|nr:hypothetical protein J007_02780 [Cryptococcus neoformans var. grubii]OXC61693.1 hypothetical protein C358_02858 [Cryptococcus neoformans var. grubii MW-RSA852]